MRVISGSAKHIPLKTVSGQDTRPTTDKIKETLFNMIQFDIPYCRFLDLYSGSGAIGIEALSRGASAATMIDNSSRATTCIKENLIKTNLSDKADVITSDVCSALGRIALSSTKPYDIVFIDPPYESGLYDKTLTVLRQESLISDESILILELSLKADTEHFENIGYTVIKEKKYKTNKHVFLRRSR